MTILHEIASAGCISLCIGGNFLWPENRKRRQLFRYWFCKAEQNKSILHGLFRNIIYVKFSRQTFMELVLAAVSKIK
jgi:hypothetical protein